MLWYETSCCCFLLPPSRACICLQDCAQPAARLHSFWVVGTKLSQDDARAAVRWLLLNALHDSADCINSMHAWSHTFPALVQGSCCNHVPPHFFDFLIFFCNVSFSSCTFFRAARQLPFCFCTSSRTSTARWCVSCASCRARAPRAWWGNWRASGRRTRGSACDTPLHRCAQGYRQGHAWMTSMGVSEHCLGSQHRCVPGQAAGAGCVSVSEKAITDVLIVSAQGSRSLVCGCHRDVVGRTVTVCVVQESCRLTSNG